MLQPIWRTGVNRFGLLIVVAAATCLGGGCASGHGSGASGPTRVPNATIGDHGTTALTSPPTAQRYEPALPNAIQEAAAATDGDRLYVVGGYDVDRNSSSAVFVFDGSVWRRGPSLPIAVNHPGAAAIGGAVYVAGGFTADGATNRVFVLAAGATSWRELASMKRPRGALALVSISGRLYAIGGRDASTQVATPEVYDPGADSWSDLPVMPAARNHVGGYVTGVLGCVAGGRTPDSSGAIDCLDTPTATWQHFATLPTATSGAAAGVVNGVTIVAGGEPAGETRVVAVVQELRTATWTMLPMLVPRHGTAFAVYHGRLWACGGATAPGFHAVTTCTSIAS